MNCFFLLTPSRIQQFCLETENKVFSKHPLFEVITQVKIIHMHIAVTCLNDLLNIVYSSKDIKIKNRLSESFLFVRNFICSKQLELHPILIRNITFIFTDPG